MISDLRFARRQLFNSPGFTIIAVLTLALGIGLNTSMFSLANALLYRRAPYPDSDRLMRVFSTSPNFQQGGFSYDELKEVREQSTAFESLTTIAFWNNTLAEPGQPAERLQSVDASEDFFTTFRVQPFIGSAFTAEEEVPGRNQVAILSHALWQERFGADPNIVGRVIRLNAEQVTIIGVMPTEIEFNLLWGKTDLWRPITLPRHIVDDRENRFFQAIGRLKPNVTPEQAVAELTPLAARWAQDHPKTNTDRGFRVVQLVESLIDNDSRSFIWMLYGLTGFVLLIACANLANLQLARATRNAKDLAIRSAMGASRARLVGHQMAEALLLSIVGGGLGIATAYVANDIIGNSIRIGDSGGLAMPIDGRVLAVAVAVSLLTGMLFGLLPALLASRTDVVTTLKQQSRGSTSGKGQNRARHALIVGEVALALVLLAGAGIMIRGFDAFIRSDHGWDSDSIITGIIHIPEQSTYNSEDKRRVFIDKLARRLEQIPGAETTAIGTGIPLFGYSTTRSLNVEGITSDLPNQQPPAGYHMIESDYFGALGIRLLDGRLFPEEIGPDSPRMVIVNETLARQFWPNDSAIGKRIGNQNDNEIVWEEIIGVVSDVKFAANAGEPNTYLQIYRPLMQEPWGYMNVIVRGENPAMFGNEIRRAVADIDPDVAVQDMYTIPQAIDRFQHNLFVVNDLMAVFALVGLALAAVGLYGVISNIVAQRTGEFGIRIALGATSRDVLALVMKKGVKLAVLGLIIGAFLAYGLNQFLAGLLPRAAATDPATLAMVSLMLLAVTIFSCWWPARRATKVDPVIALRTD